MPGFRSWLGACIGGLLTACHPAADPARQARDDARAIAMVEAAQKVHPPPVALSPEPLAERNPATDRFGGPACRFASASQPGTPPILLANGRRALVKVAGRVMILAADVGSAELVPSLRAHYVGKSHSITLARAAGDGTALGVESLAWPAVLTIRDAWDQIVFTAPGMLRC
ncbi:hypothetical protein H7F50_01945 [Novosphingobium flavum]|uniref:Uncharacterized protein n=1 Tax=Novosphingobium aerophilum TaxID=2839843 RepID=A0A7X1F910_9SPHN|nr:hypothetical protein [Novosphingobium aerophilum]MBC2652632.1 hypothetical protein [Novosphingobium aerophilum]MBC2660504.1 hypothetical protein [Novosphingobium aerophilum]